MTTRPVAEPIAPPQHPAGQSRLILSPWRGDGDPAEGRHQEAGLMTVGASRRGVLTLGLGVVLGGIGGLEAGGALAAKGKFQDNWRYCFKCKGLFYESTYPHGYCPDGGSHLGGRGEYLLQYGGEAVRAQSGWRHCVKCQGLWSPGLGGNVCPGDGAHSLTGSYNFSLRFGEPVYGLQHEWQRCFKCSGLWYIGAHRGYNNCPAGGRHRKGSERVYGLRYR